MKSMRIVRRAVSLLVVLAGVLMASGWLGAQVGQAQDDASVQLEAAIQKQFLTGDLAASIDRYQAILTKYGSQNPKVAAQALWRLAQCQEKLGRLEDARQSYERLLREHSSQPALTAASQSRLTAIVEDEEWDEGESRAVVDTSWQMPREAQAPAQPGTGTRFVVFSDLSVFNPATGDSRRLLGGTRSASFPVMSPNGRQVAYAGWTADLKTNTERNPNSGRTVRRAGELRVVNIDGSNDRSLVRGTDVRWVRPFEWSPDNRSVAALVERTNGLRQIVNVSANDGSVRVLKSSPWLSAQEMTYSEDGRFMAYQASTTRDSRQFDFYLLPTGASTGPPLDRRFTLAVGGQRAVRVTDDDLVVHVLNRLGFGPRLGDIERVRAMGVDAYIAQQLHPEKVADPVVDEKLAAFHGLKMDLPALLDKAGPPVAIVARRASTIFDRPEMAARAAADRASGASRAPRVSVDPFLNITADRPPENEILLAKMIRAVHSERQLQEVLVDFWMNHFNVNLLQTEQTATHFEEQAIRKHMFGRFEDLLSAVAHHPRMLYYLDNWRSSAPTEVIEGRIADIKRSADVDARVALLKRMPFLKESKGLNENYGRELLELHTLGVEGGYTQKDVVEVAKILTGWTITTEGVVNGRDDDGVFKFDPILHVSGDKVVLGQTIKGGGIEEGEQLLKILARHPSTARFISTKLARRFIADDPPAAVIEAASRTFMTTGGDLREVVRTILMSPQFRAGEAVRSKIKKPFELIASALRAVDAKFENLDAYGSLFGNRSYISRMGEKLYDHEAPDGNPDVAPAWMNSNALMLRLEFANRLATDKVAGIKGDLASAERLLTLMGVAKPTPLQIDQTRAMIQTANAPAAATMGNQNQMMMGASQAATAPSAPVDPAAIAVAAMLGSPQFQKR